MTDTLINLIDEYAAPDLKAGWKLVPVNATDEMVFAGCTVDNATHMKIENSALKARVWSAMLAASPTPPAEQQAEPGAVYAELPAPTASIGVDDAWCEAAMRDFADRTHALRMEQAAPKAEPGDEGKALAALRHYQHECSGADRYDEDWVTLNKRDSELRAALAAQGGK